MDWKFYTFSSLIEAALNASHGGRIFFAGNFLRLLYFFRLSTKISFIQSLSPLVMSHFFDFSLKASKRLFLAFCCYFGPFLGVCVFDDLVYYFEECNCYSFQVCLNGIWRILTSMNIWLKIIFSTD